MRTLSIPPSLWNDAVSMPGVPKDATLEFDMNLVSTYTPSLVDRFGTQNLVLGSLIGLLGVYEAYVVMTSGTMS